MNNPSTLQTIQHSLELISNLEKLIPVNEYKTKLLSIDQEISNPGFWNNQKQAATKLKERQHLSELIDKLSKHKETCDFNLEYISSCPEDADKLSSQVNQIYQELSHLEFQQMMRDPADKLPAIVSIAAGAGGLEAANWVSMLLRMYYRYANQQNFSIELLDEKRSEEHSSICIDSVSILVSGDFAYGYLKGESGVHRLIRNSPFNSGNARQTSFAAVSVEPDIDDSIEIKIEEKDIEITAQTAGGPGGQAQNRTKSAIRLKYLPQNINIIVRTERDFHANKRTALKMLKAKLYEIEMKKKQEEQDAKINKQSVAAFGSQVRSYVLTPYTMVKDHRTSHENTNADSVLDGGLKAFQESYLRWKR